MSLATKYRPKTFQDVCAQEIVTKILDNQLKAGTFAHNYLFIGPSGCGKTTLARILADKINDGCGAPIEIDAASNNGVDAVRELVEQSRERSISGTYKIIICDECHMITPQGWAAFLKCLEDTPKYTIFIFCTTDPQKVPETIQNRLQKFVLTKISATVIERRLNQIAASEGFSDYEDTTKFIADSCDGCMREAISMLEKVSEYSKGMKLEQTVKILGKTPYSAYFYITNAIIDGDHAKVLKAVDKLDSNGVSMIGFVSDYAKFLLNVCKYCVFGDIGFTTIPASLKKDLDFAVGIEDNVKYYDYLMSGVMALKQGAAKTADAKTNIEVGLIDLMRNYR